MLCLLSFFDSPPRKSTSTESAKVKEDDETQEGEEEIEEEGQDIDFCLELFEKVNISLILGFWYC